MTDTADLLPIAATQSIAVVVAHNPAIVLIDADKRDDFYAHIRREVEAFEPDLTTAKGRDAIKSLAFKIVRTKTAIDDAGKTLNEQARAQINVVDAARRDARETLTQLAADVRKPLTGWEESEKVRVAKAAEALAIIADMKRVDLSDTVETVTARLDDLASLSMNPHVFRDGLDAAEAARADAVAVLTAARDQLAREEADRLELDRLRAEAAERQRVEDERRAAEEAERARVEAERIAEERRVAAEKAVADRIRQAEETAAQAARDAEARKAREAQAERDREHADALAAERAKAAEAERKRQAEADRIAQIERERAATEAAAQREAERVAAEQAKRERNRAHRAKIMGEAKIAIMGCGADEATAVAILKAIAAGTIPHTSLGF